MKFPSPQTTLIFFPNRLDSLRKKEIYTPLLETLIYLLFPGNVTQWSIYHRSTNPSLSIKSFRHCQQCFVSGFRFGHFSRRSRTQYPVSRIPKSILSIIIFIIIINSKIQDPVFFGPDTKQDPYPFYISSWKMIIQLRLQSGEYSIVVTH